MNSERGLNPLRTDDEIVVIVNAGGHSGIIGRVPGGWHMCQFFAGGTFVFYPECPPGLLIISP